MAFRAPGVPSNGMPNCRARGLVWATVQIGIHNTSASKRHINVFGRFLSRVLIDPISYTGWPRHIRLLQDIEDLSSGRVRLSTGTLYGALRRLLADQWIERVDSGDTSRDKQTYRLTETGRRQLRTETERLEELTQLARTRRRTGRRKWNEASI